MDETHEKDRPPHPFKVWRESRELDRETVAKLTEAFGQRLDDRYIEAIENGWRRPVYEKAEVLAKVSDGNVTAHEIMKYPVRPRKPAAHEDAA